MWHRSCSFMSTNVILSFIVGTPSGQVVGLYGTSPPHSGRIYLRLVRLARRGRETVLDLYTSGNRMRIRVTRFLAPLRLRLLRWTQLTVNIQSGRI